MLHIAPSRVLLPPTLVATALTTAVGCQYGVLDASFDTSEPASTTANEQPEDTGLTDDDAPQDTGTVEGPDPEPSVPPSITVWWLDGQLDVLIEPAGTGSWEFGLIEAPLDPSVDGDCGDQCWTGEDCHEGFTDPDTGEVLGPYCHDVVAGEVQELYYGAVPYEVLPGETVFWTPDYRGYAAYIVRQGAHCWTGGTHPEHWSDLGCGELEWTEAP